jgi:hypothetical protein
MQTNIEAKKKDIAELKIRFSFSDKSMIDKDGDEVIYSIYNSNP